MLRSAIGSTKKLALLDVGPVLELKLLVFQWRALITPALSNGTQACAASVSTGVKSVIIVVRWMVSCRKSTDVLERIVVLLYVFAVCALA